MLAAATKVARTGLDAAFDSSKWVAQSLILPVSKYVVGALPSALVTAGLALATSSVPY